ncbi:hypothetical protein Y1Q_0008638 [Alligator mississippiensis]|uniref:Uncharacterized protein n=1 Tax=Alligator mississippiensis TaxID=8496 RepID=A0A151N9B0_ALLMI|nr:hypothetical protein Y1Q_0008638 [Alligator mississippiensis]
MDSAQHQQRAFIEISWLDSAKHIGLILGCYEHSSESVPGFAMAHCSLLDALQAGANNFRQVLDMVTQENCCSFHIP